MADQELNIEITSSARLEGLKRAEASLINQMVLVENTSKKYKQLEGVLEGVQKKIHEMGFLGRLKGEMTSLFQSIPVFGRIFSAANGARGWFTTGSIAATVAIKGLLSSLKEFSRIENVQTSFETILGSRGAARKRMKELSSFSDSSPFELTQVAQASRRLETLTNGALSTSEGLHMVGNVAAAVDGNFEEIASTIGRLYQGMKNGLPIDAIAKRMSELTGINLSQAKSWEEVAAALSKFNGAMEARNATIAGQEAGMGKSWGNLKSQVGRLAAPVYKSMLEFVTGGMSFWGDLIERNVDNGDATEFSLGKITDPKQKQVLLGKNAEKYNKKIQAAEEAKGNTADEINRLNGEVSRLQSRIELSKKSWGLLGSLNVNQDEESLKTQEAALARAHTLYINLQKQITSLQGQAQAEGAMLSTEFDEDKKKEEDRVKALEAEAKLKQTIFEREIQLNEARAAGDEGEEKRLTWLQEYEKIRASAKGVGIDDSKADELARRGANAAVTKPREDLSAAREELELELRILVAKQSGNEAEERKLKWIQDYTNYLKQAKDLGLELTGADQLARIGANASMEKLEDPRWKAPEVSVAAGMQTLQLAALAKNGIKPDSINDKIAENTKAINKSIIELLNEVKNQKQGEFSP